MAEAAINCQWICELFEPTAELNRLYDKNDVAKKTQKESSEKLTNTTH